MLKTVLHFGNPARLSLKNDQLQIDLSGKGILTRPLEDIACIVVDHAEVSCTTPLLVRAAELGLVVVFCDQKHMPCAYSSPLVGHTLQNLRHRQQWEAGAPAFKQAWAQIIRAKLENQAAVLESAGQDPAQLLRMAREVKSGDTGNHEAQGARYYWPRLFGKGFTREREGDPPNNWLNYGYAILRAGMARSLAGAGLCLPLGIFHRNQYNPYALADDCMEPFRPWVDLTVSRMPPEDASEDLGRSGKALLLAVLHQDVAFEDHQSPMMIAMDRMAASLARLFAGEDKKLTIPRLRSA
jgi:CRISPR-associated protein Cas1